MTDIFGVLGAPATRPEGTCGIAALITHRAEEVRVNEPSKTCHVCKEIKPIDAYGRYAKSPDGHRASCKACVSTGRTKRTPKPTQEGTVTTHWFVSESDDDVFLVSAFGRDDVMVAWHDTGWSCSSCGRHQPRTNATNACDHVAAVTRNLPRDVALRIASAVAPALRNTLPFTRDRQDEPADARSTQTPFARSTAVYRRQDRQSELDTIAAERRAITDVVEVRQMTDADRERLANRRAEKRRRFGEPEPDVRPIRRSFTWD